LCSGALKDVRDPQQEMFIGHGTHELEADGKAR
jgi:hypothetical protein